MSENKETLEALRKYATTTNKVISSLFNTLNENNITITKEQHDLFGEIEDLYPSYTYILKSSNPNISLMDFINAGINDFYSLEINTKEHN